MPVLNKYQKIMEKKWFYFGLGAFLALLLSGSAVYIANNVEGQSLIRSTQTADERYPSLIADGRGHIYGGLTTNQMNATSGLIVLGGYDPDPPISGWYGRVGIGFPGDTAEIPSEMLEVRGNVVVVDRPDTSEKEYLAAPFARADDLTVKNLQTLSDSKINIDGELNIGGDRGRATSTVDSTLLVRTPDGSYVDIGDVFEMQADKIWIDGANFDWTAGQVYDSGKAIINSDCSGQTGSTDLRGYKVYSDQWFEVSCNNYPYPPDPVMGCTPLSSLYPSSGRRGLAESGWQWFRSLVAQTAQAATLCDNYRWEQSSPQPAGYPKPAWTSGVLKIKTEYLP